MKNFSKYVNENKVKNKVSLQNLPKEIIEKLKSLEGKYINECCCNCCGCNTCSDPVCSPNEKEIVFYYTQAQIVNKLKTDVKVQDIYNIHTQFNDRFKYKGETPAEAQEPLYFKEITPTNEPYSYYNNYMNNKKLYKLMQEFWSKFKLGYPVVLDKFDGKLQLFFNTNSGSNGKENSIKSSLIKIVQTLNGLEEYKEVTWAQVLDVSIDVADDVYTFTITVEIDTSLIKEPEKETNGLIEADPDNKEDKKEDE